MRILVLTSTFHPSIGGAETYAKNLVIGLANVGHNVMVVTDCVYMQSNSETLFENIEIRRLHSYRNKFNAKDKIFWEQMQFGLYDELSALIDEYHPDLVFSNSLDLCVPAKILSMHCGIPWVATSHEQSPEKEALGISRLQFEFGILNPDAIIAGSKFYFSRANLYAVKHKNHLIYHGIDTNKFQFIKSSNDIRKKYEIPNKNYLIVSSGRITPRKGFPDVINAINLLKSKGYPISLIIAGSLNSASDTHRIELEELTKKLNLVEDVIFDQTIRHEGMPSLLSASDIVVQASLAEGLGLAVIEAMSCCRPVVTTRIPGINEIITIDGIGKLVEPNSPTELALAVESLLNDLETRHEMGLLAREHIVENFSIERMIKTTAKLFENLIIKQ